MGLPQRHLAAQDGHQSGAGDDHGPLYARLCHAQRRQHVGRGALRREGRRGALALSCIVGRRLIASASALTRILSRSTQAVIACGTGEDGRRAGTALLARRVLDKMAQALADSDAELRAGMALVGTLWDVEPGSGPPPLSPEQLEERLAAADAVQAALAAAEAEEFIPLIF